MKRTEKIIVDLKIKKYDVIRLKQLDTTKLEFQILDNGEIVNLKNKTANIIFYKPSKSIVIQVCEVDSNNQVISVVLKPDCVRLSGKAKLKLK